MYSTDIRFSATKSLGWGGRRRGIEKRKQKQRNRKKEEHQSIRSIKCMFFGNPTLEYKIGRHFRANPSCISPMAAVDHSHLGGRVRYDVLNNNWQTSSSFVGFWGARKIYSYVWCQCIIQISRLSLVFCRICAVFRFSIRPLRSLSASASS